MFNKTEQGQHSFGLGCPFVNYGCDVRMSNSSSLEHHLEASAQSHLGMLRSGLDRLESRLLSGVGGAKEEQEQMKEHMRAEMAAVDFRMRELIYGTRSHVDNLVEKNSAREMSQFQLDKRVEFLERKLSELAKGEIKYARGGEKEKEDKKQEMRLARLEVLFQRFENTVNDRLSRLEESRSVASRMISSLNRLGFNFECLDLSRKISWVVECKDLIEYLTTAAAAGPTCLPSPLQRADPVSLRSPVVTIPCDKVGEYECYLNLESNEEGFLFLQVHCIGPRYPVFLEGSILSIHGVKSIRFNVADVALGRKDPCEKMLMSALEAKKKIVSPYLDIQLEIRATVEDPSFGPPPGGEMVPSNKAAVPGSGLTTSLTASSANKTEDDHDYAARAKPPAGVPARAMTSPDLANEYSQKERKPDDWL